MNRIASVLLFGALVASAQPAVESAENAAGYMKAGLPNGGLAQGSLVVISGRNLSQRPLAQSQIPLSLELAGTSVEISVGPSTLAMPINYVTGTANNRTQISAVVPSSTPIGLGSVRVTYQGQTSAAYPVSVVRSAFGIFTINSAGSGTAVVFTGSRLNTPLDSLTPGSVAQIFGTGLGAVAYSDRVPAEPGNLNVEVEVWVGFKKAEVHYKGRIPEIAAVDQINFTVPADVPPGCAVSLLVRAGGVVSNATTVPVVTKKGACEDAAGYSSELISRSVRGLNVGAITLAKNDVVSSAGAWVTRTDSLRGSFQRYDYSQLLSYPAAGPSVGSCTVHAFYGRTPVQDSAIPAGGLDAGPALSVDGPSGSQILARGEPKGVYQRSILAEAAGGSGTTSASTLEFLTTGRFTVTGPGGPDLAPFSAWLDWPKVFNWVMPSAGATLPRTKDLLVSWESEPADGYVTISGHSIGGSAAAPVGAAFSCMARASAGGFSVPAVILQLLPATASLGEGVQAGQVAVSLLGRPVPFSAQGLDYGFANYSSTRARGVVFQ